MDSGISCLHYLRKFLPEIEIMNHDTQNILHSDLEYEEKIQKILSKHFKNKTCRHRNALKTEARYIQKLYPSLTIQYIYDQLDIFGDMPNRKELVLRLIVRAKELGDGNVADGPTSAKRATPYNHAFNNMNNNQPPVKTRRIGFDITSTVTSHQRGVPTAAPIDCSMGATGRPFAVPQFPRPLGFIEPDSLTHLNTLQPIHQEQNAISSTTNAETNFVPVIKPIITSTVTSTVTKPATITSAATSTVTSSEMDQLAIPNDTNSRREPFSDSVIMNNHNYDVPDLMEHFDLPMIKEDLPVAKNYTMTCTDETDVNPGAIAVPNIEKNLASEYENTSPFVEEINAYALNKAFLEIERDSINQPTEQARESQDSGKTEIYSPPGEIEETEVLVASHAPHYTVNVLSPTFIRIKQTLVPEKYENKDEVFNGKNQQSINVRTIASGQGIKVYSVTERKLPSANEPLNLPSTSKDETNMDIDLDNAEFDLINYIREITNASKKTIKRHCKRLNLSTEVKPPIHMLNVLVDNILTITIDSGDSDVDDYHELNERVNDVDNNSEKPLSLLNNFRILNTDKSSNPEGILILSNPKPNLVTQPPENSEKNNDDENVESKENFDNQLVNTLCSMFPEACPKYIRGLCRGKVMNDEVLDGLITTILSANNSYPKRPKREPEPDVVPENQLEILKEFLPDADPDYLRMMCDKFEGKPDMVKTFLNEAMEKHDYPTKKDYLRRQQLSAQQKQYTTEFNVENFIKLIPDPDAFFSDPSRKLKLNTFDSHYALVFLRNHFNRLPIRIIQSVFVKTGGSVPKCMQELREVMTKSNQVMKSIRKSIVLPNTENIPLLQEVAYYSHEKEINNFLKTMKEKEETERQEAKDKGLMKTCSCCYDDEVLSRDIYCCENGCEFCKSCIVKSSEVRFGEGKLDFPCLMNCSSSFSLQTLQAVLSPKLFSKVAQKKALEEIKSAGIDELEQCPFCDFATIPAEGYNIFTCMNPECMKESCRMCKEPSHIPLRCEEIEKDEDVRARTFVENKMTEALLRKCWKCGVKFFKEEGCNKMTCSCGAQMCYVCGKPVTSYKHFNGNGGDRYDLCPLYSDTNVLNKQNVLKGAEAAKAEIGNVNLKHDPAADVDKHFKERKKLFPQDHLLMGQMAGALPVVRVIFQGPHNLGPPNGRLG